MEDQTAQPVTGQHDAPAETDNETMHAGEPLDDAAQLEAEKAKNAELFDSWQRERAEFRNFKRRVEQERQRDAQMAGANVVAKTLFVLDDFDLALLNKPTAPETEGWVNGVALIAHKMRQMLESEGVQPITVQGAKFDPALHEAIMMEDGGGNVVVAELRRGYTLHGNVLRPALVKVGKGE